MFYEDFSKLVKDNGFLLWDKKNAKKFAECGANAFSDYPLLRYFFEGADAEKGIKLEFDMTFSNLDGNDIVAFADSEDVNGICMVGRPFLNDVTEANIFKNDKLKIYAKCGYKQLKKIFDFQKYCIKVKYELTNGDSVHCLYLAVRKDMQGKGVGKKLLSVVHKYADMIHKPVFLDTHKPVNVEIYTKLGYDLRYKKPYEGTNTFHHGLVRDPK